MPTPFQPRIAIVHDFLFEFGGAERVLLALHQLFPQAPVYVGFYNLDHLGDQRQFFTSMDLHATWLQKLPFHEQLRSPLRLIAPWAFQSLNLQDFDVIISSSNAYYAKSAQGGTHTKTICYCHTPPRALYGFPTGRSNFLTHILGMISNLVLRREDFRSAQKLDVIMVNSQTVSKRVAKFWKRKDAVVVYPPHLLPAHSVVKAQNYFLFVSRLYPPKHPELALNACRKLQLPLKIVGTGPMLENLKQLAANDSSIEFITHSDDDQLASLYAHARCVIYPVEDEDFGLVPVEAQTYGCPVIAHRSGGPTETISEGKSGLFFNHLTTENLVSTIQKFIKLENQHAFNRTQIAKVAKAKFSLASFNQKVLTILTSL